MADNKKRNKYDVDEALDTPFNAASLKRSAKYIKRHLRETVITLILSVIGSACALSFPYMLKIVLDKMVPEKNIGYICAAAAVGIAFIVIIALCEKYRCIVSRTMGQKMVSELRSDLFSHLQKLPFDYFDSRPHGKIMVRVVNYVNSVADFFANGLVNIILQFVNLAIIFVFMMLTNVTLSLVILSGLIPITVFYIAIKKKQRIAYQVYSNKNSNLNAYYQESIDGMKITQSFNREDINLGIADRMAGECRDANISAVRISHTIGPVVAAITAALVVILYWLGLSGKTTITVGIVLSMATYCSRFWSPVATLANLYNQVITTTAYLERIFEVMDIDPKIKDADDAEILPEIKGNIEFRDVVFEYEKDRPILSHLSFKVKAGESIALVGPTGAGKTTVVNLLSRFYDIKSGEILIDGHDIHSVTLNSLRSQMGIMLQDTFIFSGTIMENIKYGRLDATDEEAIAAAKTVCAHDFISALPDGYNTVVTERGSSLSAGQRQLVSFARTLISDPKILILDEATSAIDTKTELLVQKGLARLLEGRTSFIIAHRLSTIKNSDRIMYVANKNIAESGNHDQLMAAHGLYCDLYTSQLEKENDMNLHNGFYPMKRQSGFKMDGYYVWGGSCIKEGGKYYMFSSVWPEKTGAFGYRTDSEIVIAATDDLSKPFEYVKTVVGKRDEKYWDGKAVRNPQILKINDKFVLYYTAANFAETEKCAIGYAVSDAPDGEFVRCEKPIELPENAAGSAVAVSRDGAVYLAFYSGDFKVSIAKADRYDGKYNVLRSDIFEKGKIKDMFLYEYGGVFHIVAEDCEGVYTGHRQFGVHFMSKDMTEWKTHEPAVVYTRTVEYDDGESVIYQRREQPQLLKDGDDLYLFSAVECGETGAGKTFNSVQKFV